MKKFWMIIFLLSTWVVNAQILEKTAINLGYRYTGRNVLQAGLEFRIGDSSYKSLVLGPSMLYTRINREDKFLPEANIYYTNNGQLYGVSINQYALEPRIGISLFNIFFLNTGYAFPIHKEKYFKGITFGIQFNIAPAKASKFYDQMKMM
ncbi:hypothetical protein C1637_15705 [Chryseobacterium lactis]|uniref:DUF3575 domain-containing protein n=1 Tax=Chryseobacterium lactis TaxID=1241981 RepID=A0A3G6RS85_CHRLC|nr:hypothetical protein [Chryseobacterium lactis]AZA83944.1 hypothetical protein EG342_19535 [Chryseobacterium lactis]AZB04330.1 hypothetical protein EG341_10410 [Chryseobacterium lactis]PNW12501.1 hypothetical protein C1637_15705 [Chryseobacterium lactis]